MTKLLGKVAIVTGASRGIGRAIAIELAKEGANIVINYSKDEKGALEVLDNLKAIGVSAVCVRKDISSFGECNELVKYTISIFGKIDILINNAAISKVGLFLDTTKEEIDQIISTNLIGALYLTNRVLPHMISNGGSIVNISSIWGEVGASCETLYSITKGGINQFTKSLAKEMALSNIRVNGIAPGVIETQMNSFLTEEERMELEQEIPMGRFGLPEEVAKMAVFLCSEESKYVTGQVIKVDGGFV